jgi:hypothetical protein
MFCKTDFENPKVIEKLRAVTMVKSGHNIQTTMSLLSLKQKRIVNIWLNTYIATNLQCENWEAVLFNDFQQVCNEELFDPALSPKKDYTNIYIRDTNMVPFLMEKDIIDSTDIIENQDTPCA